MAFYFHKFISPPPPNFSPTHAATGLSLEPLYKCLNRTILFQLSRPINSVASQATVLDALHVITNNRNLVFGPGNHDTEFLGCLCFCLLQLTDDPETGYAKLKLICSHSACLYHNVIFGFLSFFNPIAYTFSTKWSISYGNKNVKFHLKMCQLAQFFECLNDIQRFCV